MGNKIIAYRHISELINYAQNNNLSSHCVILTAGNQIASDLIKEGSLTNCPIFSLNTVLTKIFGYWYTQSNRLIQMLDMYNAIDEMKQDKILSYEEYSVIRLNRAEIMESSRALQEIGVDPENIPVNTKEKVAFKKVFEKLQSRKSFKDLKKDIKGLNKTIRGDFIRALSFIIESKAGNATQEMDFDRIKLLQRWQKFISFESNIKTIYLLGFYYVTPMQSAVIDALSASGKEIVYLNNYIPDVKEAYKVWDNNSRFAECTLETTNMASVQHKIQCDDIFAGRAVKENPSGITIKKYSDVLSLVKSIEEQDKFGLLVYGPDGSDLDDFYNTFFPEAEDRNHLISFPIGQYLFMLYKMWDEDSNSLNLSLDNVRQCMATGWAGKNSIDSRLYMDRLERIQAYVEECSTLESWKDRLGELRFIQEEIIPEFRTKMTDSQFRRWHQYMSNPLCHVGAFSLNKDDLDVIEGFIDNIFTQAKLLFSGPVHIDIRNHFANVISLLGDMKQSQRASQEEVRAAEIMLYHLECENISVEKFPACSRENISEAMSYFLSGKIKNFDDYDGKTHLGLSEIESALVNKSNQKILLCFCDEAHLPGRDRRYPWPLSSKLLSEMKLLGDAAVRRMKDYMYVTDSSRIANRYLFFTALQLENLEISYVENVGTKKCTESPYIRILKSLYHLQFEDDEVERVKEWKRGNRPSYADDVCVEIADYPEGCRPQEIVINDMECPYRNTYAYGLQEYPKIISKYHLNFYASALISMLADSVGTVEEAAAEVFKLLPLWNKTEQANIKEFALRRGYNAVMEKWDYIEGNGYPRDRIYLSHFPMSRAVALCSVRQMDDELENFNCIYCTEKNVCKHIV